MSLLMKALKKAEENQQSQASDKEPTLGELAQELSLEPAEPSAGPGASPGAASETPPGAAQSAANLFQAKQGGEGAGRGGALPWIVGAGLLVLLGGGVYVYLAINHPALLRFPSGPSPVVVSIPPPASPAEPPPGPVPSEIAPVVPALDAAVEAGKMQGEIQPEALFPRERAAPPAPPPVEAKPDARAVFAERDEAIRISPGGRTEVNADLATAYRALQEGSLDVASTHYQRLLQQEPRNLDALLGMAVLAGRREQLDEAGRYYLRALEVAPRNPVAQAGLLSLLGMADPAGSEARVKQLLAQQPAAFLHFSLGNLLAAQERWNEAQQSYFQAYHLDADNADYAFNLAVSLEHLNQPKPALTYYRRAVQLLSAHGAGFRREAAEARIAKLQGMVD